MYDLTPEPSRKKGSVTLSCRIDKALYGLLQKDMIKKVLVATIVTDKSACVLFPNLKNETDMNVMFYSDDAVFREWYQDYFRYVWHSSEMFDRKKLQHEI